jgi:hypothetical protein
MKKRNATGCQNSLGKNNKISIGQKCHLTIRSTQSNIRHFFFSDKLQSSFRFFFFKKLNSLHIHYTLV